MKLEKNRDYLKWIVTLSLLGVAIWMITSVIIGIFHLDDRQSYNTKQEAWDAQVPWEDNPYYGMEGHYSWNSIDDKYGWSTEISYYLSENTIYYGWYSMNDYREQQEFLDFQEIWIPKVNEAIEYTSQIINDLPVISNDASKENIIQFPNEIKNYLVEIDFQYEKGIYYTLKGDVNSLKSEFLKTSYSNDVGIMNVFFLGQGTSENFHSMNTNYKGSIAVTNHQIYSDPETLPEVYKFNQDLLNEITDLFNSLIDWKDENYKDLISEESFNLFFPTSKYSYDEIKNFYDKVENILSDVVITNLMT